MSMNIWKWLRGDQWTCECNPRRAKGRPAQVKFVVHLGLLRFARYVDALEFDPVTVIVREIRENAPDRGLDLSPRDIRKLHAAVEKAYASRDTER